MKNKDIIKKLSLEDKAKLCVGKDYWNSYSVEKLGIPSITMSDGPNGLRIQRKNGDNLGVNESEISICFPTGATIANSWDKKLAYCYGKTLGKEAECEGINIVLGPAMNIKRNPLCGRNFEYFSEDPYLTAVMANEYVKGIQENNVGACVKHFAVNNQENRRRTIDVLIDEKNLREIYLKAFEYVIKNSKPWSVMTAYNKVNGTYCSENKLLLDILKREWGFQGITITDWGANNNRVQGILAGNELEMPGGRGNGVEEIIEAVKGGKISEKYLDEIIDRIITIALKCKEKEIKSYDKEKHHQIALNIAEESIVLLQNNNDILPLKKYKKIALIGDMAKNPRYQGAGSSTINPYKLETIYNSILDENIEFEYAQGYERVEDDNDINLLEEAIEIAKNNDIVLLCVGLTENYESEGMDRNTLNLPENQNRLITEISKVNQNVIVILSGGAVITMPWKNKVKAIITGYLGGEAAAKAMVNTIIGKNNPSGKLAESYPYKLEDVSSYSNFPGNEVNVAYKESIYVGYRYYDKRNIDVLYPFGYGLSYTNYEYSNLNINKVGNQYEIKFNIKNTGNYDGKEVAQIYIEKIDSKIIRAKKELKAFEKVELKQKEEKEVKVIIDKSAFEYYDIYLHKWNVEAGKYKILIGKSCRDIVLEKDIEVEGDNDVLENKVSSKYYSGNVSNITDKEFEELLGYKIEKKEIKLEEISDENTIEQLKDTNVGKAIFESEIQRMKQLLKEQNVNKATKVMMDLQKPLKKFYEKKNGKYTKEMIEEFIAMAKRGEDADKCQFVKNYNSKVK